MSKEKSFSEATGTEYFILQLFYSYVNHLLVRTGPLCLLIFETMSSPTGSTQIVFSSNNCNL